MMFFRTPAGMMVYPWLLFSSTVCTGAQYCQQAALMTYMAMWRR